MSWTDDYVVIGNYSTYGRADLIKCIEQLEQEIEELEANFPEGEVVPVEVARKYKQERDELRQRIERLEQQYANLYWSAAEGDFDRMEHPKPVLSTPSLTERQE